MKGIFRIVCLLGLTSSLLLSSKAALSTEAAHYVGLTYVSGIRDVWDWHEDTVDPDEFEHGAPVALSYRFAAIEDFGLRLDLGLGPIVLIMGDIEYSDLPFQFSLGYNFFNSSSIRPYARVGASIHFNSGDYLVDENTVGGVAAIGIDFGEAGSTHFFIEAAYDSAEATFSGIRINDNFEPVRTEDTILLNGFTLTLGARF
ncbi:MAG: hypothetical protein AB2729_12490 [Candidatus Thiodiazotropha taylori]|nr:hypothetical protein [Candidatus Thiodiazotropha taylori]MCG8054740.1 hypothetical protein [Candidatus Thiodiazotropha taylori]MCW4313456.1 hypothetical protein [Candidatus Thiodiazotropha taylori]MCW4316566.1 hypothetical protein [Candidatus Thiodiazotropha taylori]